MQTVTSQFARHFNFTDGQQCKVCGVSVPAETEARSTDRDDSPYCFDGEDDVCREHCSGPECATFRAERDDEAADDDTPECGHEGCDGSCAEPPANGDGTGAY